VKDMAQFKREYEELNGGQAFRNKWFKFLDETKDLL